MPAEISVAEISRRWAALATADALDTRCLAARSAVMRWVRVAEGSVQHDLRPYREQTLGRTPKPPPRAPQTSARLGFDRYDVPVFYEVPGERWDAITLGHGVTELVSTRRGRLVGLQVLRLDGGQPYELVVREDRVDGVDGVKARCERSRFVHDPAGALRYLITRWDSGRYQALRFTHDETRELILVEQITRLGESPESEFGANVARIVSACDRGKYGRRQELWRRPTEPEFPLQPISLPEFGDRIAQRLAELVAEAAERLSCPVFLLLLVSPYPEGRPPSLLRAAVVGRRYRDGVRRQISEPVEAFQLAFETPDDTVVLRERDIYPGELGDKVAQGLRALGDDYGAAAEVGQALSEALASALLTFEWPGCDERFLPIVIGGVV